MIRPTVRVFTMLLPLLWFAGGIQPPVTDTPVVDANDNTVPAGQVENGVVRLHLTARYADWYPEDPSGGHVRVAAFSEGDGPPMIPAPLIRIPEGTTLEVTVTNDLPDSTITVMGLQPHPAPSLDSVDVAPGATRVFRFTAGSPGTYFYRASPGAVKDDDDSVEREQLGGALVIDPAGGEAADRVFVINIWSNPPDTAAGSPEGVEVLTINGRSWPWTEKIQAVVGDTTRWRWVNLSRRGHPMHLHGAFFRMDAKGSGLVDRSYAPGDQREVVTETMKPWSTMALEWTPVFAGNWLFHCHLVFHVAPNLHLRTPGDTGLMEGGIYHMAGLVLGIQATNSPGFEAPPRRDVRRLRLVAREGSRQGFAPRARSYVLDSAGSGADKPLRVPGPVIVLQRGRPTDITVVNRLDAPTGVHWHGLELESLSDGVVGWSGSGNNVMRAVAPGDSFVAHLTLRRAGTFIYHTHLNDLDQLTSGLYGAIVVLEPGQPYDPATDHVYVVGWDGPEFKDRVHIVVNGDSAPAPDTLAAGVPHRLRLINISPAGRWPFVLRRDGKPVTWTAVAKDGMTLPPHQAVTSPSTVRIDVGETADFEFSPERGEYTLEVGPPKAPWKVVQRLVVP